MEEGLSRSFGTAANLLKEFRPHRYPGGFLLISSRSLCIQAALRTGSRVVQRNYFLLREAELLHLVFQTTSCPGHCWVALQQFCFPCIRRFHYLFPFTLIFPTWWNIWLQYRAISGIDYLSHSSTLIHTMIFHCCLLQLHCPVLKAANTNTVDESICVHVQWPSPAARGKGFFW